MLRITTEPDGSSTLTNANGAEIYAFITPLPQDASKVTYAKPSPIPNVHRMLATLEGGHFNPIEDKDLPDSFDMDAKPTSELFFPGVDATNGSMPLFFMALSNTIHKSLNELHRVTSATQYDIQLLEFDFPFAAAWICAFPTMVQMLELPDHGYGHVASVVGGRTIFIHAIRGVVRADRGYGAVLPHAGRQGFSAGLLDSGDEVVLAGAEGRARPLLAGGFPREA